MKVLIENVGCDDTTSTTMDLEQKELDILIKFAKENNKNSSYGCQPRVEIYTEFELIKEDEYDYSYYRINYESNLVED